MYELTVAYGTPTSNKHVVTLAYEPTETNFDESKLVDAIEAFLSVKPYTNNPSVYATLRRVDKVTVPVTGFSPVQ